MQTGINVQVHACHGHVHCMYMYTVVQYVTYTLTVTLQALHRHTSADNYYAQLMYAYTIMEGNIQ